MQFCIDKRRMREKKKRIKNVTDRSLSMLIHRDTRQLPCWYRVSEDSSGKNSLTFPNVFPFFSDFRICQIACLFQKISWFPWPDKIPLQFKKLYLSLLNHLTEHRFGGSIVFPLGGEGATALSSLLLDSRASTADAEEEQRTLRNNI